MAGDGDEVFGLEDFDLFQDAAAHLRECKAMDRCVIPLQAAGLLHRLEGDAADAWLLQRELDDGAHLVVVDAALNRHDQRGGDVERIQFLERPHTATAPVAAANPNKRTAAL